MVTVKLQHVSKDKESYKCEGQRALQDILLISSFTRGKNLINVKDKEHYIISHPEIYSFFEPLCLLNLIKIRPLISSKDLMKPQFSHVSL